LRLILLSLVALLSSAAARAHEPVDLADVVTQVEDAVANITVSARVSLSGDDKQTKRKSIGSAFVIRADGYVVT
jgi:S1-C subfamily serine protease